MAEFKISRIKYTWKGGWETGTDYIIDDVVSYDGDVYVCIRQHNSDTNIYADITYIPPGNTIVSPAWVKMLEGFSWQGEWNNSQYYNINDLVLNGGIVYKCITPHQAGATLGANLSNWELYISGFTLVGDWTPITSYTAGSVLVHGGIAYKCLIEHTSASRFETDLALVKWEAIYINIEYRGEWINYSRYKINDLVNYGSNIWICTEAHDGGFDLTQWDIYIPGQKFVGTWNNTTSYVINDIVRHGGNLYIALTLNAGISPYDNINDWKLALEAYAFIGDWNNTFSYAPGHLVRRGGNLYTSISDNTNSEPSELNDWELSISGIDWKNYWTLGTDYGVNDVVQYDANTYRCISPNISTGSNFPDNENLVNGLYIHNTVENANATIGADTDYVTFTVGDTDITALYLTKYEGVDKIAFFAIQEGSAWTAGIDTGLMLTYSHFGPTTAGYRIGDNILASGGVVLSANTTYTMWIQQTGSNVTEYIFSTDSNYRSDVIPYNYSDDPANPTVLFRGPYWEILIQGNLSNGISQLGDIAAYDKSTDGITLKSNRIPIGTERELLKVSPAEGAVQGAVIRTIVQMTQPIPPQIVEKYTLNDEYRAPFEFTVGNTYIFDQSDDDETVGHPILFSTTLDGEWNGGSPYEYDVTYKLSGDPVSFESWTNVALRLAATTRTITITVTEETPAILYYYCDYHPDEGNIIRVSNPGHSVWWEVYGEIPRNFYVGTHGVDSPSYGRTIDKPFKTVRYATEQVIQTKSIINVLPGRYYETLPIIIPANVSIVGSETRSVRLVASVPVEALANDYQYTLAVMSRFQEIMEDLILNIDITPSAGNTVPQDTSHNVGTLASAATISFLIADIVDYINYRISSGLSGTNPTVYGSNTRQILDDYNNSYAILEGNKEFLAAEAVAFMQVSFPAYSFDSELCKRDVRRYIDAFKYDLLYPGNYKTVLTARYYVNAIYGSQTEDFFYARDAVTIKDITLDGLSGVLAPYIQDFTAGTFVIGQSYTIVTLGDTSFTNIGASRNEVGIVFEATGAGEGTGTASSNIVQLERRPTAGAYVSLDPGWGPDDDRTWIHTRSPYIQNVATFGTGATGQKIDGSLHNGGNRSMVSNDFTQLISDGIGAWVTNQGRAELVSVFSYYSHIGYLAENGGIIRGANGNNSYGNFGAVANGVLDSEVPLTATINNRTGQAIVGNAFAGEVTDEMLIFEFVNAGQNYTAVNYDIVSSATVLFEFGPQEFHDRAVFEARIIDPNNGDNPGGGGYTIQANNAQAGDTTTVTLASNDPNTEADYLGMRIIITSGAGTGQYGYITAYDDSTQGGTLVVNVARESNGQPGWDHVVPGKESASSFDNASQYRIEPRITFSEPTFTATTGALPANLNWNDIVFNNSVEVFASLVGTLGSGSTIDVPPDNAEFTITKTASTYTVNLVVAGAGYAIGDTITILGTAIGGISPANDLVITVTGISDDSTNSIGTYTFEGTGRSGKFVAVATGQNSSAWSRDGITWQTGALPGNNNTNSNWILGTGVLNFVALRSQTDIAGYSTDGVVWQAATLPKVSNWSAVAYGDGLFVAVSSSGNDAAYSSDNGETWTTSSIPDYFADSSIGDWSSIAYGKGKFVALCKNTNTAAYTTDGINWTQTSITSIEYYGQWVAVAYGAGRFVAISEEANAAAFSFDGITWHDTSLPSQDGSTAHLWTDMKYGQGLFFAVGATGSRTVGSDVTTGPSTFAATSPDGVIWTARTLTDSREWSGIAFGNPAGVPTWMAISTNSSATSNRINAGARAQGRAVIASGRIGQVRLWNPGSGYTSPPTVTVTDPNNTSDAVFNNRIGNGVIAQPDFITRGTGYRTSTTQVTVDGNGFADIIPVGKYITVSGLSRYPKVGSNLTIGNLPDTYNLVILSNQEGSPGNYTARFQISPEIKLLEVLAHGTSISIREQFSQIRLTGHDFLSIGVGNFVESNYPATILDNYLQANETVSQNGGRVFYTSTDQDGNFRVGELFQVEQAAGVVTISADFFDLNGLSELALGGIRVGGTGTVVREFSTDPLFTADSNNIISTQRAIKAYLTRRLTIGGSEVSTGTLTAGVVIVGPNRIGTTTSGQVNLPVKWNISGPRAGVAGLYVAQMLFYKSFRDD